MGKEETKERFSLILEEYYSQLSWLTSLITDPEGKHYFQEKTAPERLQGFQKTLDTTREFLGYLGSPQDKYKSLHVAGTSGKGSVVIMTAALLQAAGFKTGAHISPYLQVPNEKWMIGGKIISPSNLSQEISTLRSPYEVFVTLHPHLRPSYVVSQIALTHQIFARQGVDFGVIETALGGRYDPTNVLSPEIALITNVDFDHLKALGPSLSEIAFHKAGIIKPGKPVLTTTLQTEAFGVIAQEAKSKKAPLLTLGKDFGCELVTLDNKGATVNVFTPNKRFKKIYLSLPGIFQAENAALAISACDLLSSLYNFRINRDIINQAFADLHFPGRMEKVQEEPTIILDGAHNPQKMRALAESMQQLYPQKYTLVVGMLASKEVKEGIFALLPQAERIIATQPHVIGKPSIKARDLADGIEKLEPTIRIDYFDVVQEAVAAALKKTEKDGIILITGSLYMLGEAREFWHPKEEILFAAEFG